jgi:ribonuclease R
MSRRGKRSSKQPKADQASSSKDRNKPRPGGKPKPGRSDGFERGRRPERDSRNEGAPRPVSPVKILKKPGGMEEVSSGETFIRDRSGKVHKLGKSKAATSGAPAPKPSPQFRSDREAPRAPKGQVVQPKFQKPENRGKFENPRGGDASRKQNRRPHDRDRFSKPRRDSKPHGPRAAVFSLKAIVDKNQKGFAFLSFEDRKQPDAYVPARDAENLFHGDRVEVSLDARGDVISIEVLEHRFRELVGRYSPHPRGGDRGGWVIYERKKSREEVFVPEASEKAKQNDWVRAVLEFHESGPHNVTAKITEVYGQDLPPSADVGMVAAEYSLDEHPSASAQSEALKFGNEVLPADYEGRRDLRSVPFITIDGETARDFDDAVYVEAQKSGFVLWVAIADVSHYVRRDGALDRDAKARGTSVYFPERAFHMLPRPLSENLCSLRPNVVRLAMAARIEFDRDGKRGDVQVFNAVIESKRRATYNEIQAEWEAQGKKTNPGWEYSPHFSLYAILRKARSERGSIDFDLPEAETVVKPTGEVVSIKIRPRVDAHRLIEEFMIAANEAVTDWMMARKWPFVYRVHEEPTAEALEKFQALAATVGVFFSLDESGDQTVLAELIKNLEGNPAQNMLNIALLRSMRQAVYSSTHGIHYGLASPGYTHFTSPIRRYPDLVVHRLLKMAIEVESFHRPMPKGASRQDLEDELSEICEHCSYRERLASEAERESIKLKQVRAVQAHLGEEFEAKVVGMVDSGLFVQIADPYVEGLLTRETMMDDFYQFNAEKMVFVGRRKKRTFRIGSPVRVKAVKADIDRRQIDFAMVSEAPRVGEPA